MFDAHFRVTRKTTAILHDLQGEKLPGVSCFLRHTFGERSLDDPFFCPNKSLCQPSNKLHRSLARRLMTLGLIETSAPGFASVWMKWYASWLIGCPERLLEGRSRWNPNTTRLDEFINAWNRWQRVCLKWYERNVYRRARVTKRCEEIYA